MPLKCVAPNKWEIELPYLEGCQYKLLRNDDTRHWEKAPNHTLVREHMHLVPEF